jgi:hypothetical protein
MDIIGDISVVKQPAAITGLRSTRPRILAVLVNPKGHPEGLARGMLGCKSTFYAEYTELVLISCTI